ncbi:hypothetical protein BDR04DRAFT_1155563 [Suillus decipiens]|nr:hypothetical protein BDR04DRAFT_1155563 [Suillus decipiens]
MSQLAEQERSQTMFTSTIKTKKLEELRDIATALRLPVTGLKVKVLQQILQHFDDDPDLKKDLWYGGLFIPIRSRRRHLNNSNNTAGLQQDMKPSLNPVHKPFGNQFQPGYARKCSILHLILTLRILFALVLHQRVTAMQIFKLARQCRQASIQQPISNTSTIIVIITVSLR